MKNIISSNNHMKKRKITIMVQARTGSQRFPKKILRKIEKKPMIWHIINRLQDVKGIDNIVLVTTKKKQDQVLEKIIEEFNIDIFKGDTTNVLKRFYDCAIIHSSDIIIRITADCPLIDPNIINKMKTIFLKSDYDYMTNTLPPTFPDGLDVEIMSFKTLEMNFRKAKKKSELEHVTPYIRNNPKKFKIYNYKNKKDNSHLRWTVDEISDLKVIRRIYKIMNPKLKFTTNSILRIFKENPSIAKSNEHIKRNEGYFKSLKLDQ
jgi:spore coat polysaccharide biosynthesis protein SpsF